jgi:hypothetical protein
MIDIRNRGVRDEQKTKRTIEDNWNGNPSRFRNGLVLGSFLYTIFSSTAGNLWFYQ